MEDGDTDGGEDDMVSLDVGDNDKRWYGVCGEKAVMVRRLMEVMGVRI